ncbi:glycoside hydrolase family 43 protein [Microbacterium sp. 5K110]|jgi:beta-xylosidase|uniref:glycoside hydrolase family 43 protein n=1 Tax=unclassified Microbacterium TaxID=2609290 RepID=UPI0010FDF0EB|nr:glycoside hydrolase family 43 protein [Microbacterium sp. 5K110]TLF30786.1 glycoside hydrolase family 43 protein [Microbacterium sp. 5K110]
MTDYPNPLLAGFHPDPSAVRVGDTWYLATSTFEYLPGIPIHRSTDFVTWELIGHVATRPSQLGVEEVRTAGGAWAPTLRHRDGVFHLVVTDAMGRGMLHFTATDPAGPWSDGDLIVDRDGRASLDGIDPDIAWDADGTVIVTYSGLVLGGPDAGRHLGILQARVDLDTHRALEEPRSLWSGTGGQFPEAPHLYEIDGRWYLLIAEGGTERGHGVSIARADRPEGPFETGPANPLVSARSTIRPVQNTGHGDLVIGPDGEWLCVLLGVRPRSMTRAFSALGRETFVTPVRWHEDGWPTMEPVALNPRPGTRAEVAFAPDAPLDGEWITPRRLPTELADLTSRPGWLVLRSDGSTLDDPRPVFVGRRQEHLTQTTSVAVDCTAGVGGLACRYDENFHVEIEAGAGRLVARATVAGLVQEWDAPIDADVVTLRISSERPLSEGGFARTSDVFRLAAEVDGRRIELAEVDGRFLSSETAESFTGRVMGVYVRAGRVDATSWISEGHDE